MTRRPSPLPAGRPPLDGEPKTVHSVHLTAAHVATARRLGNGNVSAGLRMALAAFSPDENSDSGAPAGHQRRHKP